MSNYEALREKLNEILPDRLELKFGCFVRRFHNTQPDMLLKIAAGTSEHSVYLASGHDGMPLELHGLSTQDIEAFEILGQRITVADVLRALYITDPLGRWVLQHNGALGKWIGSTYHIETFQIEANINLSLPLSHPDNDEACGKVLRLLTKQDSV